MRNFNADLPGSPVAFPHSGWDEALPFDDPRAHVPEPSPELQAPLEFSVPLQIAPLGTDGVYVLELSSYQLELLETFHAYVAVWLNITPDHIDRHGDLAGYVAAKENIFARQQVRDCAVIGVDDQPSRAVYAKLIKRGIAAVPVKLETPVAGGISFRAGMLVDADGYNVDFADVPTLPGDHNAQNAACAWAACRWLGVPR